MKPFLKYLTETEERDADTSYNTFPHPGGTLHQYTFPTGLRSPGSDKNKIGIVTVLNHEATGSMTAGWGFGERAGTSPITHFIQPTQTGPKQKIKDLWHNAKAGLHVYDLIKLHWNNHGDEFPNGFVHAGSGTEDGTGENKKMDAVYSGLARRAGIPVKKVSVPELKSTFGL